MAVVAHESTNAFGRNNGRINSEIIHSIAIARPLLSADAFLLKSEDSRAVSMLSGILVSVENT